MRFTLDERAYDSSDFGLTNKELETFQILTGNTEVETRNTLLKIWYQLRSEMYQLSARANSVAPGLETVLDYYFVNEDHSKSNDLLLSDVQGDISCLMHIITWLRDLPSADR